MTISTFYLNLSVLKNAAKKEKKKEQYIITLKKKKAWKADTDDD